MDGKDGVVEVRIKKFGATAFLTVIDAPVPNQEAEQNAHQLYCQGDDRERVSTHTAQVLIAVPPEFTGEPAEKIADLSARQTQLTVARVHGMLTVALCRLPGLAGYYSGTAASTFGLPFLQQVATGQFGSTPWPLWVSAWLRPGPEGTSAYTYGLWPMGHPELQVENTSMSPEDLFMYLMDTVAYLVLDEGTFTTARRPDAPPRKFTLHASPGSSTRRPGVPDACEHQPAWVSEEPRRPTASCTATPGDTVLPAELARSHRRCRRPETLSDRRRGVPVSERGTQRSDPGLTRSRTLPTNAPNHPPRSH